MSAKVSDVITTADFVGALDAQAPGRFTPATRKSIAQNIASSCGQAGFFSGTKKKTRTCPVATPANAAYALALAYLSGLRGQMLLESLWARLLDVPGSQIAWPRKRIRTGYQTRGRRRRAAGAGQIQGDTIVELECSVDDWCLWALDNNMPAELIAFIRFCPKMLYDFKPTRELTNSPCPRTVAAVGRWLNIGERNAGAPPPVAVD